MPRFRNSLDTQTHDVPARRSAASRMRGRLWMLLAMLALVVVTMRQLSKPRTVERLGQLFAVPEVSEEPHHEPDVLDRAEDRPVKVDAPKPISRPDSKRESSPRPDHSDALDTIEDNTYFRPAESAAWFRMFERLQHREDADTPDANVPELTYVQLLKQPDVYRAKLVTIRGTVRREEVETPAENALGLTSYHRLVIEPRGGGHWPFVVYCLELPSGFPRGDHLNTPVSVTGYFFKNWSYAWQDGLGLAPVVLARSVSWTPAATTLPRRTVRDHGLPKTAAIACVFATFAVWWVWRNTRRPNSLAHTAAPVTLPDATDVESVREQLGRLAEAERGE